MKPLSINMTEYAKEVGELKWLCPICGETFLHDEHHIHSGNINGTEVELKFN